MTITFPAYPSEEYDKLQKIGKLMIRAGAFVIRNNSDNLEMVEAEIEEDERKLNEKE